MGGQILGYNTFPGPVPHTCEKAVPWYYSDDVYYHSVKKEVGPSEEKSVEADNDDVKNFAGQGRMTRSGRVFLYEALTQKVFLFTFQKDL